MATASYVSLSLINWKHCSDESVTSFIYRWSELLLLQSGGSTADQDRDKLLFSSHLVNEKNNQEII